MSSKGSILYLLLLLLSFMFFHNEDIVHFKFGGEKHAFTSFKSSFFVSFYGCVI